jgi:hypothetical protein
MRKALWYTVPASKLRAFEATFERTRVAECWAGSDQVKPSIKYRGDPFADCIDVRVFALVAQHSQLEREFGIEASESPC